MAQNRSRRNFLRVVPAAAVAGLALSDHALFATSNITAADPVLDPVPFQVFTAKELADDAKALQAEPGNKSLVNAKALPFTIVMTTETAKSAKEFEWHEGRDHIVQIIEGSTQYEVGGKPKDGRKTKPGEWLAPASDASTTLQLAKGDILTIPRGTPHRRSTKDSVTLILTSIM